MTDFVKSFLKISVKMFHVEHFDFDLCYDRILAIF